MRYGVAALMLVLGGCGSLEAYENARSVPEAIHYFEKHNGLLSEEAVGENPYDNDPQYRMAYCRVGAIEYWSSVAACRKAEGTPRI